MDTPLKEHYSFLRPHRKIHPLFNNQRRNPLRMIVAIVGLLILTMIAGLGSGIFLYLHAYEGQLYRGVNALDMDMSGYSRAEAVSALTKRYEHYATAPLTIHYRDHTLVVTPQEYGLRFNPQQAVESLYSLGRQGDLPAILQEQASLLLSGQHANLVFSIDHEAQAKLLRMVSSQVDRSAQNATLQVIHDGNKYSVSITPSQTELHVNTQRTLEAWNATFVPMKTTDLQVIIDEQQPAIVEADLAATQAQAQQLINQPPVVHYADHFWPFTPSMMAEMLVYEQHPDQEQKVQLHLDEAKLREHVTWIAGQVDRPARDATIRLDGTNVMVQPEIPSDTTDQDALMDAFRAAVQQPGQVVEVTLKHNAPGITATALDPARAQAQEMLATAFELTLNGQSYDLGREQLAAALLLPTGKDQQVSLDKAKLSTYVRDLAAQIDRPARNATIGLNGTHVVVTPGIDSITTDVDGTVEALSTALLNGTHSTPFLVKRTHPDVTVADLVAARDTASTMLASTMLLTFEEHTYTFSQQRIAAALVFSPVDVDGRTIYTATLKQAPLKAWISAIADDVNRRPRNATFWLGDDSIHVLRDSAPGVRVDEDATLALVNAQAATPFHSIELQVTYTKPDIDSADRANIHFPNLLAESSTSYIGSIPPRWHNVELAARKLNGAMIAPGAVFSFNDYLGPQSLAAGFQVGYGIMATKNGGMETVPSVAGGICQVASTLFHSVFWSGLPVVERHTHLYWISRYVSHGIKGMDATVDDAGNVDFKFKNTTGKWLAINAYASGGTLKFQIWGTDPGWKVTASTPVITNVSKTDPALVYQNDPTLPLGQQLEVEHAEDGFGISFTRTVWQGNTIVNQQYFSSTYNPSHNVIAVGTRGR